MMESYKKETNEISREFIEKWRRDIVKINPVVKIGKGKVNRLGHTAPFPEDIPEMAIRYFSGVGDTVVDHFTGSGTTGIVAQRLGRNFIGYELNADYCAIANERIAKARAEKSEEGEV